MWEPATTKQNFKIFLTQYYFALSLRNFNKNFKKSGKHAASLLHKEASAKEQREKLRVFVLSLQKQSPVYETTCSFYPLICKIQLQFSHELTITLAGTLGVLVLP